MPLPPFPPSWEPALAPERARPSFQALERFLEEERRHHAVFPPADLVFAALEATPLDQVRVLILGQDPYHDDGQAHGLAFSVQPGVPPPPSLVNIFKELHADLGVPIPKTGCLLPWARQGVLLLNTVLTVRAHQAHSHRDRGWEPFTDAVIRTVSARAGGVVFVLWGAPARKKLKLIDQVLHPVIQGPHPSPLSAHKGFFGSRPFSAINRALREQGKPEIDWRL